MTSTRLDPSILPSSLAGPPLQQRSVQTRVALFTLLLMSAVTFMAISALVLGVLEIERDIWRERQRDASQSASTSVNEFLDRVRSEVFLMAALLNDDEDVLAAHPDFTRNFLETNPAFAEIVIADGTGRVLQTAARGEAQFSNLFTLSQSRWFALTRDRMTEDDEAAEGEEAGDEASEGVIEGDEDDVEQYDGLYLGEVQLGPDQTPYLLVSAPYGDDDVIGVNLNMRVLNDVVSGLSFAQTGSVYIVEAEGGLIAHSDTALVQQGIIMRELPAFAQVLAGQFSRDSGIFTNFRDQEVFGLVRAIPNTDWLLFTEVDLFETSENARTIGVGIIIISLVSALVLVSGLGLVLRRVVLGPLEMLRDGAKRVEAGDFTARVPVERTDEIGQAVSQFNQMVEQVGAQRAQREQLIRDLQRARRLAEENTRIKSEFLATMSHELRTPLNAIEGFSSIMLNGMNVALPPKAHTMVERIAANSKRLLALINDFLDLSRIESGRFELVSKPLAPADLARRWEASVSVLAERRNLDFTIEIAPDMPETVYGDDEAISKIVINLLSNAFKFTHEGGVTLKMDHTAEAWTIGVRDTGIGIPPHAREYIFDEFRQVDTSSRREYGGTGLGLAIVQRMARLMGGTVTLQSKVGIGSTFTVTLPLAPSPLGESVSA
jgi:signal transduction histidine kinase